MASGQLATLAVPEPTKATRTRGAVVGGIGLFFGLLLFVLILVAVL
jgi:hypothetical protein